MKKAVELFPLIYTTSSEWEDQILSFIQRNELDVNEKYLIIIIEIHSFIQIIAPYIPTSKPQLEPGIYEEVLKTYLKSNKYDVCMEKNKN